MVETSTQVSVLDSQRQEKVVSTIDALIALVGELQANPSDFTLLARVKGLTEQLDTVIAHTDQVENLLNTINTTLGSTAAGLTDAQLRAAPLALPVGAATESALQALLTKLNASIAVTGPLTDAQLRASALPLPTGAATSAKQDVTNASLTNLMGYVDQVETRLADILSALGSVPVTGPLTSGQLASAGLATQSTLASILSVLQAQLDLANTIWTDDAGGFFVRREVMDSDTGTITVSFTNAQGTAVTPGAGLRPASDDERLVTETMIYDALASGTGYSTGDVIIRSITINRGSTPATVLGSFWLNATTGSIIASAPSAVHIAKASQNTAITSSALPSGASTSALQTTGNSTLASILSTLQTAVAVTGPLTNTQLRASAIPVSAASLPLPTGAATETTLNSILSKLNTTISVSGGLTDSQLRASAVAVTGPLTDTQLRASAVPISATTLPLPTGAATQTTLASVLAALQGGIDVTGPLTNTQLRASPVPVSATSLPLPTGAATETSLLDLISRFDDPITVSGNFTSGGLTNTELRASPITVTGALTDSQLRASAVPVSVSALPLPTNAASQTTLAAILSALQGTLTVSGSLTVPVGLTDAQLRASAVGVSATALPLPTGAATETTLIAVKDAIESGLSVSGGLTDDELRASPIDVAASSLPLPSGAATETTLASILSKLNASVAVTGALTDTQLRASAVPVSMTSVPLPTGAATETTLASVLSKLNATVAVTGPLTDTQLRASAVPVSATSLPLPTGAATETTLASVLSKLNASVAVTGALTDSQLRASAVPVSATSLPLPTGAATAALQTTGNTTLASIFGAVDGVEALLQAINGSLASVPVTGPLTSSELTAAGLASQSTLASILSTLQAQASLASTLWTDDSDAFYVKRDVIDPGTGEYSVEFTTPTGDPATPGVGLRPVDNSDQVQTQTTLYTAIDTTADFTSGDTLIRSITINQSTAPPTIVADFWLNVTSAEIIDAPDLSDVQSASNNIVVTSSALPDGAATEAAQTVTNTKLTAIQAALENPIAVTASVFPLPTGAATQTTLAAVLSVLQGTLTVQSATLPLPTGAATLAKQDELKALIGEVQTTPTANTLLSRLATIATKLDGTVGTANSRLISSAAGANATVVKNSAGNMTRIVGNNTKSASVFLKIYNKATAPSTSDTPRFTFEIPAYSAFTFDGITSFSTGISYRITAGSADADATGIAAGDVTCLNIEYN